MRDSPYTKALALVALLAGLALRLGAQTSVDNAVVSFDSMIRNYNLITLGNATLNNYGDTQGPLAVQGNLTLSGSGSVADQSSNFGLTSDPTLYVNGQLYLSGQAQLNSGYASTPNLTGSWTFSSAQDVLSLTGGTGSQSGSLSSINAGTTKAGIDPRLNSAPANWNWSTLDSKFTAISSTLASATSNGTITISGQTLSFVAPTTMSSGIAIFTLNAANLSGNMYNGTMFSNVQFNVPANINFVINVINAAGTTIFGDANFNSGNNYDQLLWNIVGTGTTAGTVTLGNGSSFYGSILAPDMNITNTSNTILDGQVVADNFSESGAELHYTSFSSVLVPEPGVYGAAAVGLCAVAIAWHHHRRKRTSRVARSG